MTTNALGTSAIGPSFGDEIIAAGLGGPPFSRGANGDFAFDPSMTAAQIQSVMNIYAAHNPTKAAIAQLLSQVQIASSSNSAVDATYACSRSDRADMRDEAQYIQTFGAFPGGITTMVWTLPNGSTVSFSTTAQFIAVVKGIGDYLTGWKQFGAGEISAPLSQPFSIA